MRNQIDIDLFREQFENRDDFYFQGIDSSVPKATVTSWIYVLRKKDIIQYIGRGVYKLGATKELANGHQIKQTQEIKYRSLLLFVSDFRDGIRVAFI